MSDERGTRPSSLPADTTDSSGTSTTATTSSQTTGATSATSPPSNVAATVTTQTTAPPIVPNVVDQIEEAARAALDAAGITSVNVSREPSATVAEGYVISQSPTSGNRSDSVQLTVSSGSSVTFTAISFQISSPANLSFGQSLRVRISYTSTSTRDVRILVAPTQGTWEGSYGTLDSDYNALGAGTDTITRRFWIDSGHVTTVRVYAVDSQSGEVLTERFYTTDYQWN